MITKKEFCEKKEKEVVVCDICSREREGGSWAQDTHKLSLIGKFKEGLSSLKNASRKLHKRIGVFLVDAVYIPHVNYSYSEEELAGLERDVCPYCVYKYLIPYIDSFNKKL